MDKPQEAELEVDGTKHCVPDVLARHADELSEPTLRAATLAIRWATNDELRKCPLTPNTQCVLLREVLRVYRVLLEDTKNALEVVRNFCTKEFSFTCEVSVIDAYKLASECGKLEVEREKLICRLKAVEAKLAPAHAPIITQLRTSLAAGERPSYHLIIALLGFEQIWSRSGLFTDGEWQTRICENIEALSCLNSAVRGLVLASVDTWLAPLVRRERGVWTSGLLQVLQDSLDRLIYWEVWIAFGGMQDVDKDACYAALGEAIDYTYAVENLDFSSVPDTTPTGNLFALKDVVDSGVVITLQKNLRIEVVVEKHRVVARLDAAEYPLEENQAFFLQAIIAKAPTPISGPEMQKDNSLLEGVRIDRVRRGIPAPINELIVGEPGKGYFLKSDAWRS